MPPKCGLISDFLMWKVYICLSWKWDILHCIMNTIILKRLCLTDGCTDSYFRCYFTLLVCCIPHKIASSCIVLSFWLGYSLFLTYQPCFWCLSFPTTATIVCKTVGQRRSQSLIFFFLLVFSWYYWNLSLTWIVSYSIPGGSTPVITSLLHFSWYLSSFIVNQSQVTVSVNENFLFGFFLNRDFCVLQ